MTIKIVIKAAVIIKLQFKVSKILKFIDAFSGIPLDGAKVRLLSDSIAFSNKAGGFYVISNIPNTTYTAKITMTGYQDKQIQFIADGSEEIQLVSLTPILHENGVRLKGTLSAKRKLVVNQQFYYAVVCEEYSRIITGGSQEENLFRVQVYDEHSLEGRKFAFYDSNGVYTFGKYDYFNQRYNVKKCDVIPNYQNIYLLFEETTNEKGCFSFDIPKHIIKGESIELLFFSGLTYRSQTVFSPFNQNINICLKKG